MGTLRNTRLVGNPLRRRSPPSTGSPSVPAPIRYYDLPDGVPVLGVLGGSQGAQVVNDVVARIADDADADQLAIVHLTGPSHHEAVAARAARSGIVWRTVAFEEDMTRFYAAADMVLARAGAITVSELAMTGTAAVLVPLEAVGQEGNADFLARGGGAVVIAQADIDRVPVVIQQMSFDPDRRRVMGAAAAELARPEAADVVAAVMSEAAGG